MIDEYVTHSGGCHCGAVAFEVEAPAKMVASDCNCSICRMSGYLHLIVPRSAFSPAAGCRCADGVQIQHRDGASLFCGRCGVKSFYVPRSNPDGYSVNVRCLDSATIEHVEVQLFDDNDRPSSEAKIRGLSQEI